MSRPEFQVNVAQKDERYGSTPPNGGDSLIGMTQNTNTTAALTAATKNLDAADVILADVVAQITTIATAPVTHLVNATTMSATAYWETMISDAPMSTVASANDIVEGNVRLLAPMVANREDLVRDLVAAAIEVFKAERAELAAKKAVRDAR